MKRYLKSIHTRYMLTFMTIMILTILILGMIITNIITNFTLDLKLKEMYESNVTLSSYFRVEENDGVLPEIKDENGKLSASLAEALKTLFLISPQTGALVFDGEGNLILHATKGEDGVSVSYEYTENLPEIISREQLPLGFLNRVQSNKAVSLNDSCDGYFSNEVYLYAKAITTMVEPPVEEEDKEDAKSAAGISLLATDSGESSDGKDSDTDIEIKPVLQEKLLGVVICYDAGNTEQDKMLKGMMTAIISTLIWIMIASLVAIFGISYYSMKPLRQIGQAAKSFSRGKFNVRVKVRGNNELAELAESFNQMASAIESKDEMQKNFLSNVSHDLKTPMTTIAGFVDGILDGAIPRDKQDYYLNIIKNEVKRLSRLVTSLLDISRLQSGERKFEFKQFNICELTRQTVLSFENQLEEKKLNVEFDTDDFDMMVYGDTDAINQVIYNLCHNAIKFSYNEGLYRVSIKYDSNYTVRFTMYNEGIGIASDDIPYVFDRFYKSDNSRGLDKTGTGLGLFITKTIVEAHGQKITVESEYEKWCMFSFTLPRNPKSLPKGDK
ncbi:MAG: HAMP domain-containing histidine kinase [Clostridia bacterium]|nr:HAMP domain-containing histidine kinase [Clostridia bacterium]